MQIELLLNSFLKNDHKYQELTAQLQLKRRQCLNNLPQKYDKMHCNKDHRSFGLYFEAYLKQIKNKGQQICLSSIKNSESRDYQVLKKNRRQCLQFYTKSFVLFNKNINDKLKSLVEKLQFDQL